MLGLGIPPLGQEGRVLQNSTQFTNGTKNDYIVAATEFVSGLNTKLLADLWVLGSFQGLPELDHLNISKMVNE